MRDRRGEFAGLDQVNIQLPPGLSGSGEVDVQLTVDGRIRERGARGHPVSSSIRERQFQSGSPITTSGGRRDLAACSASFEILDSRST